MPCGRSFSPLPPCIDQAAPLSFQRLSRYYHAQFYYRGRWPNLQVISDKFFAIFLSFSFSAQERNFSIRFFCGSRRTGVTAQMQAKPAAAPAMARMCRPARIPRDQRCRGTKGFHALAQRQKAVVHPGVGQAEQIGGEGGQHRRQRRVAECQPRIHCHDGPPRANRNAAESPSDTPKRMRSVGRRPILSLSRGISSRPAALPTLPSTTARGRRSRPAPAPSQASG